MEKPQNVMIAASLQCLNMVIGVICTILDPAGLLHKVPALMIALILLISLSFMGLLTFKMWSGKNWARITLLVFYLVGLASLYFTLPVLFSHSSTAGIISVFQQTLQGIALFLVFIPPGSAWFSQDR